MTASNFSKKRGRGVLLSPQGWQKFQQAKQALERQQNWDQPLTREQLSEMTGLSVQTIGRILRREEGVDRQSLERFLGAFGILMEFGDYVRPAQTSRSESAPTSDPTDSASPVSLDPEPAPSEPQSPPDRPIAPLPSPSAAPAVPPSAPKQDWGEALDVSVFYGRQTELADLQHWILEEHCRLVALLGLGGIGKSSLSVRLAFEIQAQFEIVVWRSLQNAPPLTEFLDPLLEFLLRAIGTPPILPETLDGQLSLLMDCLRSHRCLLILDNVESILSEGTQTGHYRSGYEGYGQLLRYLGEVPHQSCILLTSREKPKEIVFLEGENLPVRSLSLQGLHTSAAQDLFRHKGEFSGSESDWQTLIRYYGGNPLALKLVAATTQEFWDGNIADVVHYIEQGVAVFQDIRDLLESQFDRLSEVEQKILTWLAINREPSTAAELLEDLVSPWAKRSLPDAINSLRRRSLVEKSGHCFSLQPVVLEYVTDRFVSQVCQELETPASNPTLKWCKSHALLKAQAKDYVQDMQQRLILKPVLEHLLMTLGGPSTVELHLKQILQQQQQQAPQQPGYLGGNLLNLLIQIKTDLRAWDFSDLAIWQADLRGVNLAQVSFRNADLAKSVFAETFSGVMAVAFSPDGKRLATGDVEGKIYLWQVADGKPLLTWQAHSSYTWSVSFSPDGRTLASGGNDGLIHLWDLQTGNCLASLTGHRGAVWSIGYYSHAAHGDSSSTDRPPLPELSSSGEDGIVRLWDLQRQTCIATLEGHTAGVSWVDLSPDRQSWVTASYDRTVRLWEVTTGHCLRILEGHTSTVYCATFSPDGTLLATSGEDHAIRIWQTATGKCLKTLEGHSGGVFCVSFSPDGRLLASSSSDTTGRLWDVASGLCLQVFQGHTNSIHKILFSPEGQWLVTGGLDHTVRLWDTRTGQCFRVLKGQVSAVATIALSPEGTLLASGSLDNLVRLWDVQSGDCLRILEGHRSWIFSVSFSPRRPLLASGSVDGSIRLWNPQTGDCLRTLYGHQRWVFSLHFSPDGEILASGSYDSSIRLWQVGTGRCVRVISPSGRVFGVQFSPDGTLLASGGDSNEVQIWDPQTGRCLRTLSGHRSWVFGMSFSPDGSQLATASNDCTVRIWAVQTGECLRVLAGHQGLVRSVAFSPDGQTIASGSFDHTVRVWNARTGECLRVLEGHQHGVWSVGYAFRGSPEQPEDLTVISGSQDETIKCWDPETGICLRSFRSDRLYEEMDITGVSGLTHAQKITLNALGAVSHL